MNATHPTLDKTLLFVVLAILGTGLVMVASASMPIATYHHQFGFYFFIKQFIFAMLGIIAAFVAINIPTELYNRFRAAWLVIAIVLLCLVLVPGIGRAVNGSRRWIHIGPIALQVSELVKLCAVMYISGFLVQHGDEARETFIGVLKPLGMLAVMGVLLLLEPDFGATVVVFVTVLGVMFMAGIRIRWFLILIAMGIVACTLLVYLSPYRLARLTGFLHPWANQYGSGYQLTQSLIAFGRGGIFGDGLGNSIQKLFYLPEAHTDFILAITGEELGFVGIFSLLALYAILIWRGLKIAQLAQKLDQLFDAYLAYGITFWLGLQMIVNYGVNLGLLPTKGLTLPFISYGGSSLLIDCAVIGILLRIHLQNQNHSTTPNYNPPSSWA